MPWRCLDSPPNPHTLPASREWLSSFNPACFVASGVTVLVDGFPKRQIQSCHCCFTTINCLHTPYDKIQALKHGPQDPTRPSSAHLFLCPQSSASQTLNAVSHFHNSASCHSFCSKRVSPNIGKLALPLSSSYYISFLEELSLDSHPQWTPSYTHHVVFVVISLSSPLKRELFDSTRCAEPWT